MNNLKTELSNFLHQGNNGEITVLLILAIGAVIILTQFGRSADPVYNDKTNSHPFGIIYFAIAFGLGGSLFVIKFFGLD
jgi:hypothetical protein